MIRAVSAALGVALLAAPASAADAGWDKVVAAARQEGQLNLYAVNGGSDCIQKNLHDFTDKFGIKVQSLFARGSELSERLDAERASGHYIADMSWSGPPPTYAEEHNGMAVPLGPIPNRAHLLPGVGASDKQLPLFVDRQGILVNTDEVKPETELKSWQDLLAPRWKGKIMADTFYINGQGSTFFDITYSSKLLGAAWHQGLAKQNLRFNRDIAVNIGRIAQGEAAMYMPLAGQYLGDTKGLPIRFWVPEEGAPFYSDGMVVIDHAPHPNAARVLINYLLDPGPQLACANAGVGPSVEGVLEHVTDPRMRALESSKLLGEGNAAPDHVAAILAAAKQIYQPN